MNFKLLKQKLIESNYIEENFELDSETLKILLNKKFNEIDYNKVKEDIIPFINDVDNLNLWNKDFFVEITNNIEF